MNIYERNRIQEFMERTKIETEHDASYVLDLYNKSHELGVVAYYFSVKTKRIYRIDKDDITFCNISKQNENKYFCK